MAKIGAGPKYIRKLSDIRYKFKNYAITKLRISLKTNIRSRKNRETWGLNI